MNLIELIENLSRELKEVGIQEERNENKENTLTETSREDNGEEEKLENGNKKFGTCGDK